MAGGSGQAAPSATASNFLNVTGNSRMEITVNQTDWNWTANTNQIEVRGRLYNDSGSSVTVKVSGRAITGADSYSPADNTYTIPAGGSVLFLDHTFTESANADGNASYFFHVHFDSSNSSLFPGPQTTGVNLVCDRIPKCPSSPGTPTFDQYDFTSVRVSWPAPSDNGGLTIDHYTVRTFKGLNTNGPSVDASTAAGGSSKALTISNLVPGQIYTMKVFAVNLSADNIGNGVGWSPGSVAENTITLIAAYIRSGGGWKAAAPYIRTGGVWKVAVPYIRSGGVWKKA